MSGTMTPWLAVGTLGLAELALILVAFLLPAVIMAFIIWVARRTRRDRKVLERS